MFLIRWNDDKHEKGVKWSTLEHSGPLFAPPYTQLPNDVKFYYKGKVVKLNPSAEELATFYGKFLEDISTTNELFNSNFLKDWQKVRILKVLFPVCVSCYFVFMLSVLLFCYYFV